MKATKSELKKLRSEVQALKERASAIIGADCELEASKLTTEQVFIQMHVLNGFDEAARAIHTLWRITPEDTEPKCVSVMHLVWLQLDRKFRMVHQTDLLVNRIEEDMSSTVARCAEIETHMAFKRDDAMSGLSVLKDEYPHKQAYVSEIGHVFLLNW